MMKLTKQEWLVFLATVLGIFLVAIIIGMLVIKAVRYQPAAQTKAQPRPQQAAPALTTAKAAYPPAESLARQWHNDAQLTRVTAAWRQPTEAQLLSGQTSWAFYFYSPAAQESYIVSVTGQSAHASRIGPAVQIRPVILPNYWQVDSPQAIHDFLEHGGREFLQKHPQASVNLQLNVSDAGQVEWSVMGVSTPDQTPVVFFLNATVGMAG